MRLNRLRFEKQEASNKHQPMGWALGAVKGLVLKFGMFLPYFKCRKCGCLSEFSSFLEACFLNITPFKNVTGKKMKLYRPSCLHLNTLNFEYTLQSFHFLRFFLFCLLFFFTSSPEIASNAFILLVHFP